jgi:hypothetical protein
MSDYLDSQITSTMVDINALCEQITADVMARYEAGSLDYGTLGDLNRIKALLEEAAR